MADVDPFDKRPHLVDIFSTSMDRGKEFASLHATIVPWVYRLWPVPARSDICVAIEAVHTQVTPDGHAGPQMWLVSGSQ